MKRGEGGSYSNALLCTSRSLDRWPASTALLSPPAALCSYRSPGCVCNPCMFRTHDQPREPVFFFACSDWLPPQLCSRRLEVKSGRLHFPSSGDLTLQARDARLQPKQITWSNQ
eukprot:COSAG01_NODE_2530_length_7495_cov_76.130206_3_plen_114_part_00